MTSSHASDSLGNPAAEATPDTIDPTEVPPLASEPESGTEAAKDEEEVGFSGAPGGSEGELAGSGIGDAPTGVPREAL